MDSLMLQAMAIDLGARLSRSRIDRVVQTAAGTLVLRLWTGREKCHLVLNAETPGGFYLGHGSYPAPATPPRFCQLLRARLRRLEHVEAEPLDRVVHFRCRGPEGVGYDLVYEGVGTRGNLILVDDAGKIVDLLWRQDSPRTLLPGYTYRLPEPQQQYSWLGDDDSFRQALAKQADPLGFLQKEVTPITPVLLKVLTAHHADGGDCGDLLDRMREQIRSGTFVPCWVHWDNRSSLLPVHANRAVFDQIDEAPDLSTLIEKQLEGRELSTGRQLADDMRHVIRRQQKKLAKRLKKIRADGERYADPESLRKTGELLLANIHRLQRGLKRVEVDDYYCDPPTRRAIDLDPTLTPQENIDGCFKLYRKAQRFGEHHARRSMETERELTWLEEVELSLDEAVTPDDLYQVQLELEAADLLQKTKGQLGRRAPVSPEAQLRKTATPGGWPVFWGKNNRTNDYLSRKMTEPDDLWFHAHGKPGCHLVLKTARQPDRVEEDDILYAAAIAAGYSRGKDDRKVEVIVAKGRAVRKAKGAKPGLVTVDKYHTVVVVPVRIDTD